MASGMKERRCNGESRARTQSNDYAPGFQDLPTCAGELLRAQQKADPAAAPGSAADAHGVG
jgi:hypothetical protein